MINKVILGTVQLGLDYGINNSHGKPSLEESYAILTESYQRGIRVLDTAEGYGNAQEIIGEYHRSHGNIFKIISKFSGEDFRNEYEVREHVDKNLKVLNITSFSGYMFHTFADFQKLKSNVLNVLSNLKKEGKIQKIGVSLYTNDELREVLKHREIDFIQMPFNLLDNMNQRQIGLEECKQRGVEVHTRSVFLQGLFFKPKNALPSKLKVLVPYLQKLDSLAKESNIPLHALALAYVYEQSFIDHFLMGVDSREHLSNNLSVLKETTLRKSVIAEINSIKVQETKLLNPTYWN